MKKSFLLLFGFISLILASCGPGYNPAIQILPEYIKKVYVKPFVNNTNQFALETKFTNAVIEELLSDGQLSIVNTEEESDGILTGAIKRYILQPLIYDVNGVAKQYKLWVIVSASFIDKRNNVTLWEEPDIEGIHIYSDIMRKQSDVAAFDGISEEETRDLVWEKLAKKIVRRMVKGFGSITIISKKKVSSQIAAE